MNKFIIDNYGLELEEAIALRNHYHIKYGTTLYGLMKEKNVNPLEFLKIMDNSSIDGLVPNKKLQTCLKNLEAKKLVYTNGSDMHAKRLLEKLELDNVGFENIVTINTTDFIPKPQLRSYEKFLQKCNVKADKCIFFEDSLSNLITAYNIGMQTALIEATDESYYKFVAHKEVMYFARTVEDFLIGNFLSK